MAEIRVRPKRRSLAWLWVLLTLVVLAVIAWYLVNAGYINMHSTPAPSATTPTSTTGAIAPGTVNGTAATAFASPLLLWS